MGEQRHRQLQTWGIRETKAGNKDGESFKMKKKQMGKAGVVKKIRVKE